MRLKKLEVTGFKSFLEKTAVDFTSHVTGVVGPNGCGKSNIVDAIKWVTGELSFKELRGRSMEDLIFAGSEFRAPTGMAEVSLTLDNTKGLGPEQYREFTDIHVLRRIFRDGTSEFYINKIPCRLRDIVDLFLDTGVGQSSYSIIEQGRVGLIVSSKPEDRRLIIEEAAGISKFKHRKKAAQRKMDFTRQNLLRVTDILGELKRQVQSLERAARKAEKYRLLRDRTRVIDLVLAGRNFSDLQASLSACQRQESDLGDRLTSSEAEMRHHESRLEEQRLNLLEVDRSLEEEQGRLFIRESEIQALEGQLQTLRRDAERWRAQAAEESARATALAVDASQLDLTARDLDRRISESETERAVIERDLLSAQADEDELTRQNASIEKDLEELQERLMDLVAREAEYRNELSACRDRTEELVRAREAREKEAGEVRAEMTTLEGQYTQRQREMGIACQLRFGFEREEGETRGRLGLLREEEETHRRELTDVERRIEGEASRLKALEEFERTYQGFHRGVRSLKERGVAGETTALLLADLLQPAPGFERALEAALGDRIEWLIVERPEEAVALVEELHSRKEGRATFLPRSMTVSAEPMKVPGGVNVRGALLDFIAVDEVNRDLARFLLGDLVVVESLTDAVKLWGEAPGTTFVTVGGDVMTRQGIITGGSWETEQGVFDVRRDIRELRASIRLRTEERERLHRRLQRLTPEISATQQGLSDVQTAFGEESRRAVEHEKDLERLSEGLRRLRSHLEVIESERKGIAEGFAQLAAEALEATKRLDEIGVRRQESEASTAAMAEHLSMARQQVKAQALRIGDFRVRAASCTERLEGQRKELSSLSERIEKERRQSEAVLESSRVHEREAEVADRRAVGLEETRESSILQHEALRNALQGRRIARDADAEKIRIEETALKRLREGTGELSESMNQLRLRSNEERIRLDHLVTQIRERHGVELRDLRESSGDSPLDESTLASMQAELNDLREKMSKIGDVNLAAIDEVRELTERHAFLSAQKDDLEKTLEALTSAIRKINATTRDRFQETFEAVNTRFQEIFPRLFRGGKAKLILLDPENLLETGVDIVAQPPGKRLQNMNLLSGGEKALTAIALLFAIFQHKAPPFCLLDEVDAPLDDANVGRFLSLVREMADETQFILITHNKATMEIAQNLYGVTMEEPGVSRLVSVRIQHAHRAVEPTVEIAASVA